MQTITNVVLAIRGRPGPRPWIRDLGSDGRVGSGVDPEYLALAVPSPAADPYEAYGNTHLPVCPPGLQYCM